MALSPVPGFRELLNQAKQFGLMLQSMEGSPAPAAFAVDHGPSSCGSTRHRSQRGYPPRNRSDRNSPGDRRSSNNNGGFRGQQNNGRKPYIPRCQICRGEHFADKCLEFLNTRQSASAANLAHAFQSSCNISPSSTDRCLYSGASVHMTNHSANLDSFETYSGKTSVIVGNGHALPISHIVSR